MLREIAFEWDIWNIQKNEIKHGISRLEAESVFFDKNLLIFEDQRHSSPSEKRWIAYGKSAYHNVLMMAFTLRASRIRIISSRRASKKERNLYEENHK
jgi:hypothetical protein